MASDVPRLVCLAPSQSTEALLWMAGKSSFPLQADRHVPIVHLPVTQLLAGTNDVPLLVTSGTKVIGTMPICQTLAAQPACQGWFAGDKLDAAGFNALLQKYAVTLSYYVGQWAYAYLLPEKKICLPMLTAGVPFWESTAAWLGYPLIAKLISDGFAITPGVQPDALGPVNTN